VEQRELEDLMADDDYSEEELTDVIEVLDKLQAVARGFPMPTVVAAASMLIVNATVQKSPSIEKACSALRIGAKTMQDDARARWDHIKSAARG
jgi:hypothetical protein